MSIFSRKSEKKEWDRENLSPAVLKSICTGEETFGFLDRNGHFTGIQLVRDEGELKRLLETYSIARDEVKTIY